MAYWRFIRIINGIIFGAIALIGIIGFIAIAATRGLHAALPMGFFAVFGLLVGGLVQGIFWMQTRSLRNKGQRVKAEVEAIAARLFDAPGAVRPGYDLTATMPASWAGMVVPFDVGGAFTTEGEYRGVRVSAASHVSTAGRQMGEFSHVYSHVLVDVRGLTTRFGLMREGVGAKLGRAVGATRDVQIGDPTFDAQWNIDADEALARAVLDADVRAKLQALQAQVSKVSLDFGAGHMNVLLTNKGLALRWPGELSPDLAAYVRDLLLEMRGRILAHVERQAVRQGEQQTQAPGYRVGGDQPEYAEVAAGDQAAARAKR